MFLRPGKVLKILVSAFFLFVPGLEKKFFFALNVCLMLAWCCEFIVNAREKPRKVSFKTKENGRKTGNFYNIVDVYEGHVLESINNFFRAKIWNTILQ